MKLKVYHDNFPLVLIRASAVQELFDQVDLAARQNPHQPVLDAFHINWIHEGAILVPSFHIIDNMARVGMGRHRLTMLSRHMVEIPAAFERDWCRSNNLENILSKIVVRKMEKFEDFEYPDLPVQDLGNDINGSIALDWKKTMVLVRSVNKK